MIDTAGLSYFIAEQKGILVVSFIGGMVRQHSHVLTKCAKEIGTKEVKWVILNFRDVPPMIDRTVFPSIALIQKTIRAKGADLRMASLHPELRHALDGQGLLRPNETVNNLSEALKSLPGILMKAA